MAAPSIVKQASTALLGNSSGYLVAIITGIVVARVLGPADKGVASFAALVMALFTTFGNGLQAAILHQCGRDPEVRRHAYAAAVRLLAVSMVPVVAGLCVLAALNPRYASFFFVAVAVPFGIYTQIASAIFLLESDMRSNIIQGSIPTFGVALTTIPALTIFHGGLRAVLAIWAIMFVLAAAYGAFRVGAYFAPFDLRTRRTLVRDEGWFSLKSGSTSLASFLNLRIDVFVVSFMLDTRLLGIYTLAVASGELMWQISRPLTIATAGRVASSDRPRAVELTAKVSRYIFAVECLVGVAIFLAAPLAVRLVYGAAYVQSGEVVRWLLPGLIAYAAQTPLAYFITVKEGRPAATFAIQITCVIVCAAISVATIRRLGIFGAALATTCTYGVAALSSAVLFARFTGTSPASLVLLRRDDLVRVVALVRGWLPATRGLAPEGGTPSP